MERIKIMLVDDEVLAIEYLRDLIHWEEAGYEIVAESTNSFNALDMYERLRPQILIVDIRMPGIDGLELSRRILEFKYPVKIILLTAYKDFEYAKQALKIGVSNYLLKHNIKEDTLLAELGRAKESLEIEREKDKIVSRQFIKGILEGEQKNTLVNCESRLADLSQKNYFALIYAKTDRPYPVFGKTEPIYKIKENDFLDLTGYVIPKAISYIDAFQISAAAYLILIAYKKSESQKEVMGQIHQIAACFQRKFNNHLKQSISLVIEDKVLDILAIREAYLCAAKAMELNIFFGRENIHWAYNLRYRDEYDQGAIAGLVEEVSNAFEYIDNNKIRDSIGKLFDLASLPTPSSTILKKICLSLIGLLDQIRMAHHLPLYSELPAERLAHMSSCYHVDDLKQGFIYEYAVLRDEIKSKSKYSKKVQETLQYIVKRYNTDLTIAEVADAINISGIYLSTLMKKETGRTFLQCLTNYRIDMAKKLLESSDLKVYEISEKVGYKTSQYFSQVFCRIVGQSPVEYRSGRHKNE